MTEARKHKDYDGWQKNWQLIKQDWQAFRANRVQADQPGWTHQWMQDWRTLVRQAQVLSAALLGVVWPITASVLVGYVVCLALRLAAAQTAG